ncbi:fused FliR family export protein/FlhB family type III secretion system protein [Clostridioides mangenotii]|uniref:fused FliR family export protein/FlhB family type III secretion system protein n=1 Tax=Metaclostridioides mangenotii TaxID=1540 RepID=UPI001C11144C|nr:fused FliR family export protein/FlhB family type III secretion system protein [Clostridioides mangenotii]MBU5307830.1 fused FliR family export protein/FlhB family type III secretion system protein [Clostridioides mangenotii]MCR1953953.1 fused FliR family export protein/FlhB family type III secretion system protein [Clostridioides mangenotii]
MYVFIRVLAFFASLTMLFPKGTPNSFKVIFSIMISVLLSVNMDVQLIGPADSTVEFILCGISETLTGLILGYITNICFYSIRFAGSLIDFQMGLSMLSIFDPGSNSQTTLIENVMNWLAIMIFFSMDGFQILISGIKYSFSVIEIGSGILINNTQYIVDIFAQCFLIGFKIAIPIIICLILADFILGLISRSVPQLNVMLIGMPLKLLVGMILIMMVLPLIINEIVDLFKEIPNMYDGTFQAGAIFMLSSEKTEEATPKRKRDERKKGNIAKSKEVSSALTLVGFTIFMPALTKFMVTSFTNIMTEFLTFNITEFTYSGVQSLLINGMIYVLKLFLPVALIFMSLGVAANLIQTGLVFSNEGLKPKLSKIDPIKGLKNIFSMKNLGTLVKNLVIVTILGYIGYSFYKNKYIEVIKLSNIYIPTLIYEIEDLVFEILAKICIAISVIAFGDFLFQKFTHKKSIKMTKQEVKEEFKQAEGDPQLKSKIKQKQREISSQTRIQAVPQATVIITNPTHISVAIKYEKGVHEAPVVIAKGAGNLAFKIREIAKEHDIEIMENKPLARTLYKNVAIDQEVPEEMYQAVAEILVAVYKIKNRYKSVNK